MLRKISLFFLLFGIVISGVTAYAVWRDRLPLVSPVALIDAITGNTPATKSKKVIYGFFPYWNIKMSEELNISELTHFAYFAIDLNPDGTIYKTNERKEQEPGWNKLNSEPFEKLFYQVKLLGQKTVITVTAMDPDTISSITDDPQTSLIAISSIIEVYKDKKFDDINVDFEYVGEPSQKTRDGFTSFVKKLKDTCLSINPKCQIDVDVFGDAAEKYRLWDLAALEPFTDRFIVMAYDYYRKSSTQSGPVAPLTGKCKFGNPSETKCLDQDIVTHISQFSKVLPSEKIILGIPFYGYEWQTAGSEYMSNTYPRTGAMASYSRIQSIFSDPDISSVSAQWSDLTLSPFLSYVEEGKIFQIQFEDAQSLTQKIKLVESANLGGIAIWALGYETPYQELWQPIKKLSTP